MTPIEALARLVKNGKVTLRIENVTPNLRLLAIETEPYDQRGKRYGVSRVWSLIEEDLSTVPIVEMNFISALLELGETRVGPSS